MLSRDETRDSARHEELMSAEINANRAELPIQGVNGLAERVGAGLAGGLR